MPAYNPPPQVLFSPVSNFYQGKAIRQGLAAGEQDAELKGLQIEAAKQEIANAPSERKAAEEMAAMDKEKATLQIAQLHRDGQGAELQRRADVFGPVISDTMKMWQSGDEAGALEFANTELPIAAASLGDDVAAEMAEHKGADGEWQSEELMRFQNRLEAHYEFEAEGSRTAQKFIDKDGNAVQGSMGTIDGVYTDSNGRRRTDITPIAPGATQSDLGLPGASNNATMAKNVREVMGSTDNLMGSLGRIDTLIDESPQASLGLPGGVSGLVDRTISAADGFAEIAGGWAEINNEVVDSSMLLDVRLYQDFFEGVSGANAAIQATSVGVAYALARAANPDGRISDADVKHQLNRLGLDQSSKTRIKSAIYEVKREQLGNAMNWLRSSGATKTKDGQVAFMKYEDALNKMDSKEQGITVTGSASDARSSDLRKLAGLDN